MAEMILLHVHIDLYMTHCDMLPFIANNMPLDCIIDCKYIAFYKFIEKSEN